MSEIGYYRYKVIPKTAGSTAVKLYVNGSLASTATIVARGFAADFRILKYLDPSGRYRFFAFNNRWQLKDKPTAKGEVTNFITSILSSQTAAKQIGYKNERTLTLAASTVSADELDKLCDIFTSPRVYLYVGNGSNDRAQDWVLVTVSGDGIGRRKSASFGKVTIDVKLPEYYAITTA